METIPKPFCLELARETEIEAGLRTSLEKYGTSPIRDPSAFLEATGIKLNGMQFQRLPPDFSLDSGRPPSETIASYCKLANLSEIFYRCISQEQWLRTVIESQNGVDSKEADVTIHSNVVPRHAYLTRVEASCLGHQCQVGFFPTTAFPLILHRRCKECALAEQLKRRLIPTDTVESARFWFLAVGDVEVVEDLGSGSDGAISRILWRKGTFARKRFRCHVPHQNANFSREVDVALEVSHPNIVHIFGCSSPGSGNSRDCDLFMELLKKDLRMYILDKARVTEDSGSSPLPFRTVHDSLNVLLQIAEAMRHLHEKNFVHGNLKPHNILLDRITLTHSDAQYHLVKVADFGCAQRVDSASGTTVEPFDFTIGTTAYTAPEVLRCRQHGSVVPPPEHPKKIDVYSFGVVAFQVLTGVVNLYEDRKCSELAEAVIQGLRPDSGFNENTLDGDVRSRLLPLVRRCWTNCPEDRPSFSQICSQIEALQRPRWNLKKEKGRAATSKGKGLAF